MSASIPPQMPRAEAAAQAAPKELTPAQRIARAQTLAKRALAYWKMSALLFVLGCGVALVVALNLKRSYRSECVVLVRPALKTDDRDESPSERATKLAPKLKDTLLTRSRLEPLIKEYGLYTKTVEGRGMVDAVEEMRSHVGFRGRDSETFVISFEDENQERVKTITQRLAETMIEDFRKGNLSTSQQQLQFLQVEEQHSEEELENANRELATFLATHPEFAADTANSPFSPAGGGRGATTFPTSIPGARGDAQLASLIRQKARIEAEITAAQSQAGQPAPPPPPNTSIENLTRARDEAARRAAAAQADLADKRTRYTDQHPDVVQAKAQAEAAARALHIAEQQLEQAKAAAAGAPPPKPDEPNQAPADLTQKLNEIQGQINARQAELAKHPAPAPQPGASAKPVAPVEMSPLVALETEWARLLRATSDAKAKEEDLSRRLDRARLHASATEASGDDQMEIIDPAYRPTRPSRGGRGNAAMIGGVVALLVAIGYAFARVLMNDTLFDAMDIETLGLVPVLGVLPSLPPVDKSAEGSRGASPGLGGM